MSSQSPLPAHSQDQRHLGQPNPPDTQKALSDFNCRTTREKLVERTQKNRVSIDMVDLADKLPAYKYDSPAPVSNQISRIKSR
ncbi:DUF2795 domain-containing protein [Paraburkholderia sabiae]|uniref:DUF2795 domain-containing protein n=1 Tax=Paraburkholderia sabiae TaxID=273251 RepID=A0ABU9QS38_9BURK|nr:DUF2795 domain-containing protein [Paraburkholderia sabiae]WJZ72292.1 DUF2795 domain-containing protein [Paraburkholderia sabiae]CAD6538094.1 hypothetical protein LMG24235_03299 [Paraburkholderia sabiae]